MLHFSNMGLDFFSCHFPGLGCFLELGVGGFFSRSSSLNFSQDANSSSLIASIFFPLNRFKFGVVLVTPYHLGQSIKRAHEFLDFFQAWCVHGVPPAAGIAYSIHDRQSFRLSTFFIRGRRLSTSEFIN